MSLAPGNFSVPKELRLYPFVLWEHASLNKYHGDVTILYQVCPSSYQHGMLPFKGNQFVLGLFVSTQIKSYFVPVLFCAS